MSSPANPPSLLAHSLGVEWDTDHDTSTEPAPASVNTAPKPRLFSVTPFSPLLSGTIQSETFLAWKERELHSFTSISYTVFDLFLHTISTIDAALDSQEHRDMLRTVTQAVCDERDRFSQYLNQINCLPHSSVSQQPADKDSSTSDSSSSSSSSSIALFFHWDILDLYHWQLSLSSCFRTWNRAIAELFCFFFPSKQITRETQTRMKVWMEQQRQQQQQQQEEPLEEEDEHESELEGQSISDTSASASPVLNQGAAALSQSPPQTVLAALQEKEYQTSISSGFLPQPAKDPAPADASNEQTQTNAGDEQQMVNGHTSPLRVRSVSVEPTVARRASPRSAPDSPHSQHSTPTAVSPVRLSPRSQVPLPPPLPFVPVSPSLSSSSQSLSIPQVSLDSVISALGSSVPISSLEFLRVPAHHYYSLPSSPWRLPITVYADEPSSIIAYALASLKHLYTVGRIQAHEVMQMQQQWHQNEQRIFTLPSEILLPSHKTSSSLLRTLNQHITSKRTSTAQLRKSLEINTNYDQQEAGYVDAAIDSSPISSLSGMPAVSTNAPTTLLLSSSSEESQQLSLSPVSDSPLLSATARSLPNTSPVLIAASPTAKEKESSSLAAASHSIPIRQDSPQLPSGITSHNTHNPSTGTSYPSTTLSNPSSPINFLSNPPAHLLPASLYRTDPIRDNTALLEKLLRSEDKQQPLRIVFEDGNLPSGINPIVFSPPLSALSSSFSSSSSSSHPHPKERERERMSFSCTIYFPVQFHALRLFYCAGDYNFFSSLCHCAKWRATGGKSGSTFSKTSDDRFVLKFVKKPELQSFLNMAIPYFAYLAQHAYHHLPSFIVPILGAYTLNWHKQKGGEKVTSQCCFVMPNLFADGLTTMSFDLKGSTRNRYVKVKNKQAKEQGKKKQQQSKMTRPKSPTPTVARDEMKERILSVLSALHTAQPLTTATAVDTPDRTGVNAATLSPDWSLSPGSGSPSGSSGHPARVLLDDNLMEFTGRTPLPLTDEARSIVRMAIYNDTLFLAQQERVDYSLLLGVHPATHRCVFGLIDYVRAYTSVERLETSFKSSFGSAPPTVIPPAQYKQRFRTAMERFFNLKTSEQQQPVKKKQHKHQHKKKQHEGGTGQETGQPHGEDDTSNAVFPHVDEDEDDDVEYGEDEEGEEEEEDDWEEGWGELRVYDAY